MADLLTTNGAHTALTVAITRSASALVIFVDVCVVGGEGVPAYAVCLARLLRRDAVAAPIVLCMRHRFEVGRVDAVAIGAPTIFYVVEFETFRDRADQ
jgi:hypothetical protein